MSADAALAAADDDGGGDGDGADPALAVTDDDDAAHGATIAALLARAATAELKWGLLDALVAWLGARAAPRGRRARPTSSIGARAPRSCSSCTAPRPSARATPPSSRWR